jgi:signal transduction histidine kinase
MSNIVDELLLLAEVRKADVQVAPLDMAPIIADAQQRLSYLIEPSRGQIVVAEAWPVALGYAPWIEEVWVNYLSNALKYGGLPPYVEVGGAMLTDDMARFWVRDNGAGITVEDQGRLFTPFTRLDSIHAKGHGLGLSIVRRIVEKLNGRAWVESTGVPGQGSTFFFTLPKDG